MPYNFFAGPATNYPSVLEAVQREFLNYKGLGYSLVEISHRDKVYEEVHNNAIALLKNILSLGEEYQVLLLGGGATLQFSMLPFNYLHHRKKALFVHSGAWSKAAIENARKTGIDVEILWDGAPHHYTTLPTPDAVSALADGMYVHITTNETIHGIQWQDLPDTGDVPLVADMSSDIASKRMDMHKFSLFYAGTQKNLGIAGLTVVVIKKDFLARASDTLPNYLSYKLHAEKNSLLNTPPVFAVWMLEKVLAHIQDIGGVATLEERNRQKAAILYQCIDESDGFYVSRVDPQYRSMMNVVFTLATQELEELFTSAATAEGLLGLKGHRSVGGCRASLYNAMDSTGVHALVSFMDTFRKRH